MFYPFVYERVRVVDRSGEYVVHNVDDARQVADIHLVKDSKAAESEVPFAHLFAPDTLRQERWLSATVRRLHSAESHIRQSSLLIAELHGILLTTMEAIRRSQELLAESDRVIARAQTLGCSDNAGGLRDSLLG